MTASRREAALQALFQVLLTIEATGGPLVRRNDPLAEPVPEQGLLNLHDGDPGEPEVTLSPPEYLYEHRALLDVVVQAAQPAARDELLDGVLRQVSAALADDTELGGAVDYCEPEAPVAPDHTALAGAEGLKIVRVPILLVYSTPDPLG